MMELKVITAKLLTQLVVTREKNMREEDVEMRDNILAISWIRNVTLFLGHDRPQRKWNYSQWFNVHSLAIFAAASTLSTFLN